MKATDLAAALERIAEWHSRRNCAEDATSLTEAARVLREVADPDETYMQPDAHISSCAIPRAAVWDRKAVCTCGLNRLRRVVGHG